ncbi:disulfide bond formation protein B [Jannaschia sp. M317]|uniref:disulfide bond formation protein B n=1 Tax=Jannaschia sp. M317 TaxID=2867011 RepID=UPI0021A2BEA7|nr:disulfide bond formation protein B [Jannaschia sp. M317]UWQ19708.1 disulfide bond formation protein B [Jannaschia sp. M317]
MTVISTGSALDGTATRYLLIAWVLALGSSLAVLFIGEVLGQMPCTLCWYQRAFMFPLAIVLGVAVWREDTKVWVYALPLAAGGVLIAGYHMALYVGLVPAPITPCSDTGPSCTDDGMLFLGLPIPMMALGAFAAIGFFLLPLRRIAT